MEFQIRPMQTDDRTEVRRIYLEGIATGQATFETEVPSWEGWNDGHLPVCRLIAHSGPQILGWAALSAVSRRRVYAGVAEVSIYVGEGARYQGIGKSLLRELIDQSERFGIWMLQAGIFPENTASINLHKTCGFREVGLRERIGNLKGIWKDVVLLERRSKLAGI